jgi:DNA repair exonuclease SbcCD ATPase subunit
MRASSSRSFVFITAAVMAIVPFARAEDPARGRLPDGRAFRTDSEGNQLVDYIAELEVNNEALTRQVKGLQEELDTKQHSIDRLSNGKVQQEFAEKDLMGGAPEKKVVASAALLEPQCPRCEVCAPSPVCPQLDCSASVRPLKDQLDQARLNLDIERKQHSSSQSEVQNLVSKLQAQLDLKAAEVQKRGEEVESVKQDLRTSEAARQSAEAKQQAAEAEVKILNTRLESASSQIQELDRTRANLADQRDAAQASLKQASTQLASARSTSSEYQASALRVAPAMGASAAAEQGSAPSQAKLRALESVRSSVMSEAGKLKGVISDRDRLLAQYNAGPHRVGIRPSPAVSSRGMSVPVVTEAIQSADSVSDLMKLRRDVTEIRGRMQEDMALMKRMGKVQ